MTTYRYAGKDYPTAEEAEDACYADNPEVLDDDLPDFFNAHIEICGDWQETEKESDDWSEEDDLD